VLRCAVVRNGLQKKRAVVNLELFPLVGLLDTDKRNRSKNIGGNGCRPKARPGRDPFSLEQTAVLIAQADRLAIYQRHVNHCSTVGQHHGIDHGPVTRKIPTNNPPRSPTLRFSGLSCRQYQTPRR